jgi:hypothetical protein
METLRPPFIISIFGKPASGKSHLMKYILGRMRAEGKIDVLFVFTSTKKNEFYDNMVDSKFVMRYSEKLLAQFWKKAEAISHRGKNILLVFDDCIGLVNWKAPIVEEVFSNHWHNHVSILVATQYPNKLPMLIREVIWQACIFKQATKWSRKAVHDSYGKDYGSVKEFVDYMNSLPDYGCICVDTTKSRPDKYKKMKAPAKIARFYYRNTI